MGPTTVLEHRGQPFAGRIDGRRALLLAVVVLGLLVGLVLSRDFVRNQLGFGGLVLLAIVPVGVFVAPHRLVVALAPAWLLAPLSVETSAIARAATWALALGLVLRFIGGTVRVRRTIAWFAVFATVLAVSLLYPAVAGSTPISPAHDLAGLLAGLVVAASAMSAPPSLTAMAKSIAIAGAVLAGVTLASGVFDDGRLIGAGLNANSLGGTLAMPFIAAVALAWHGRQPVWLVVAAPSAVALVETQSRGALVAIAAGIGYLLLRDRSWRQRAVILTAVAALSTLFGRALLALLMGGRSTTELDTNNEVRAEALRLALQVAADHPLRGIGYAMFPPYAAAAPQIGIFINTHNEYARLACEAGVPAAAVFVVLLVLALRGRRGRDEAVLCAVVVVYATTLLFGNFMSFMFVSVPFWLALGCLLARGGAPPPAGPDQLATHGSPSARPAAATVR